MISYATAYTLGKPSKERTFLKHAAFMEKKEQSDRPLLQELNINLLNIFTVPFLAFVILSMVSPYLSKDVINQLPKAYQSNKYFWRVSIFVYPFHHLKLDII